MGTALPIEGFSYVQVEGSPAVYQVSDQSLLSLSKEPVDFADASPVQFENDKVQNVKLTWKGQTVDAYQDRQRQSRCGGELEAWG